ncbi:hypothetical protein RQP46_006341 [Phenoliferia psychrophenolica]
MTRNQSLNFVKVPSGFPKPGEDLKRVDGQIDLDAPLKDGEVLTRTLSLSLDPYMRGRMRPEEIASYVPAFTLGAPMTNFGVSEVLATANPAFKKGDKVYGFHNFQEYSTFDSAAAAGLKVLENKENLPWTTWVGSAGMPGQTAWYGLHAIGKPVKGETIFVSGASGPVGQIVIALSQQLGLKVVASAGSEEKVAYLKDTLKVDVAFNYKTQNTLKMLEANRPDIYWDNVGGETLDAALATLNPLGRIVGCGQISEYNGQSYPLRNMMQIVAKSLTFIGFIIIGKDTTIFYDTIPKLIASGAIKAPREDITKGLDNGESFLDLLTGKNFGKAVISFE